jgi:hypothetical protein
VHQAVKSSFRAAAILLFAVVATGAMAQNAQPNAPSAASSAARPGEARGPLPAPVGHRQPKPSDLPQDIGKRENQPDQSWRDLDDKLRICKGC